MSKRKILITGGSGFIGTNLIDLLVQDNNISILNIDLNKPSSQKHIAFWKKCDIMDMTKFLNILKDYRPTHVVHLAAKADTSSNFIDDYIENTTGTRNVVESCNEIESINKVIITSTQYVYKDIKSPIPKSDTDFKPHTVYGESKAIAEKITRKFCKKKYIIIRPTNVWGPYNVNYARGLFTSIDKGLFVLPKNSKALKSYGYVKNICDQIICLLLDENNFNAVFYVGEKAISSNYWASEIAKSISGKYPFKVPKILLYLGALFGEVLIFFNIRFPLYLVRYKNMVESYEVPIEKTLDKYELKYPDLKININETITWFKNDYKN